MDKLAEIERAAEKLSPAQRTQLLFFIAQSLQSEQAPLPPPRQFSAEQVKTWMDEDEEDLRRFDAGA